MPEFLRNITGISFFFENIYAFLWFGIAIATLYLLFPVYAFFLSNNNKPVIFTIVFTIIWTLLSAAFGHIIREDLYGFLNRIPVFVIGACFSACAEKNVFLKINNRLIIYGFAALAGGLILSYLTNYRKLVLLVPVSNCFIPNILITLSCAFFCL